jgi:hypothetical protein
MNCPYLWKTRKNLPMWSRENADCKSFIFKNQAPLQSEFRSSVSYTRITCNPVSTKPRLRQRFSKYFADISTALGGLCITSGDFSRWLTEPDWNHLVNKLPVSFLIALPATSE